MGESRLGCRSVNISQGKAAITMKLLGFLLLLPLVISSPIQDEKVETSIDEKQLMIELVEKLFNSDRDSRELEVELEKGKGGNKKKRNNNKAKKLSAEEKKAKAEEKKARAAERKSKHKERKNKKHGGKHNKRGNKGNKGGNKKKKQEQEQEEMLAHSRRNKHSRSGKQGKKEKEDFTEGKTLATLSGIATLRRSGDVEVMNAESHKIVKSKFSVGPLQLEVKKTVGKGKERSIKTAKAITEKLTGKIVIKVKPDGTSHVRSVVFMKPEEVDVRGTLGDKKRSDLYLKRSIGQVRPMAAQRVLKMARYVMKSPSTVERRK